MIPATKSSFSVFVYNIGTHWNVIDCCWFIVSDQLIPQFCKPQIGQFNKIDKRHTEGNFRYPNESSTISAKCFSKATSNPNNMQREETEQKFYHLSDSIQITHNARPLPPVPHKIH